MTNPTTDLLRVVELVESAIAAEGTMHEPSRVDAAKEAAYALVREHGRTLLEAMRDAERSTERRALLWLAGNDCGMSSQAICHHMLGLPSDGSYPHDPSDLGRCLRMLELFPEWKPRMPEMATYSPEWAALAARWDELAAMMDAEVGINWTKGKRAPETFKAMRAAIDAARQQENRGGMTDDRPPL